MEKTFQQLHTAVKDSLVDKATKRITTLIVALILALIIFQAGVTVGFRKAHFVKSWNDNYFKNFGPHKKGFPVPMPGQFPNAHGTIGKIISVNFPTFIVEDRDKTEKIITLADTTKIRKMDNDGIQADLSIDTYVVVVGDPNDQGQINAKFIRIIPAPPTQSESRIQ